MSATTVRDAQNTPPSSQPSRGSTQPGEDSSDAKTTPGLKMTHAQIMLVIYGLLAGMFLGALDQTIVGTAIRTIGDDLHGLNQQAWVTTAYLIASTIMTPIYGKLSDVFGRRPLFLSAIAIFILGSLLASFSTSMVMLAAFRAVQGIGAGGLMSLPLAIMGDMLAPRERAKYQGFFLAVFGISSVIGPLVGGLFAGANQILFIAGWRWVFLINVPIGIIAMLMVIAFLHLPSIKREGKKRIDWWGATFVIVTLGPLLLVAEQGRDWGWASVGAIVCYVVGGLGLLAFILTERAMGDDAIIPLRLFHSQPFSMATFLGVLVGFGMFGAMLTLPLYLQIVVGLSPTESGFATLPMVVGLMCAAVITGQVIARTGKYGFFPITGSLCLLGGFFILTFIHYDTQLWFIMIGMFTIGLGLGQMMQTLTLTSQNAVGPTDIGVATSASTFFRQIGGTTGVAVLLSILFASLPGNISSSLTQGSTLRDSLDAALNPAVASAPNNRAVMDQMWNPILDKVKRSVDDELAQSTKQVDSAVEDKVAQKVKDSVADAGAKGNSDLAKGATALASGSDKLSQASTKLADGTLSLSDGTTTLATGTDSLAKANAQMSSGLGKLSRGEHVAAGNASKAMADFTKLGELLAVQQKCQAGQTSSCAQAQKNAGQIPTLMKRLGTEIGTTDGALNGAAGAGAGLDKGLSEAASGSDKLATASRKLSTGAGELAKGTKKLSSGTDSLSKALGKTAAAPKRIAEGSTKLAGLNKVAQQKVKEALPAAQHKALEQVAKEQHLSVKDNKLTVDYSDPQQRQAIIDKIAPQIIQSIKNGDSSTESSTQSSTSDTSFLNGADPRLTKPFMEGFTTSMVHIYWVGLIVIGVAFLFALFLRVPPLRQKSALEEAQAQNGSGGTSGGGTDPNPGSGPGAGPSAGPSAGPGSDPDLSPGNGSPAAGSDSTPAAHNASTRDASAQDSDHGASYDSAAPDHQGEDEKLVDREPERAMASVATASAGALGVETVANPIVGEHVNGSADPDLPGRRSIRDDAAGGHNAGGHHV